jgi:glucose/arabinose dehydrogenase
MNIITQKGLVFAIIVLAVLSVAAIVISWKIPDINGQTQNVILTDLAFPNLIFNQPIGIFPPGDGSNRLFVIEQPGVIRVFENSQTVAGSTVFLDISNKVLFGGEQGLLGLAFHPNYLSNGYFYVDYVSDNPRRTVIARYSVSPTNPNQALENSELIILEVNQPFSNHNGGQLTFGVDGYLYIGLGDGGSGGDPIGNAQNRSSLLGKILRINVDLASQGQNYSIPADNPFSGNLLGYKEEIYAYGFRNPWRFSFDSASGRFWVADVGQGLREEIDLVEKGKNYGWNIMEGSLTYSSGSQVGLELPVWEYDHSEGFAVIGGFEYHGTNVAGLNSRYVFGDYGSGKIWALQYDGDVAPSNTLLVDTELNISSFGVDEQNELYVCALDGKIYVLRDNTTQTPTPTELPTPVPSSIITQTPTPNPTTDPSSNTTPAPSPTITEFPAAGVIIATLFILVPIVIFYKKNRETILSQPVLD